MCGIAGYKVLSNNSHSIDLALLEKMQLTLTHRGPDGYRTWINQQKNVGFIHRRLSILDLSDAGFQPMHSPDKRISVMCNGEIYNHPMLRKELEALGYRYSSNSDTETILHAYQEWGINFLERLNGMFAIVIYDQRSNELFLIRDRIGIKPIYFSLINGILSFSSEIKALWCLPWLSKEINPVGLYHYLTYMVTPVPFTLYKNVYKLPAGYYLKVGTNNSISFQQWYNLGKTIELQGNSIVMDEGEIINELRSVLRNSIKQQMQSDVPYGVFLSGGIDSSLNVALMSEFTDRVKTFTVAFSDGPEYSELVWARKVATQFNTDHHEIIISEKEAFEFYETMIYHQDEPLADCVCIPLYYVSKLLKDSGVTVVQVGEGSDELFCGYNTYAQYIDMYNRYWKPSQKFIPSFAKKTITDVFTKLFPHKINKQTILKQWADNKSLFWSGAIAFPEHWKQQFLCIDQNSLNFDPIIDQIYPGIDQSFNSYAIVDYHLKQLYNQKPDADFLTSIIWLELKQRLPELLLMRVDKMTMATSVEARVPYLDHNIVEFAMRIPPILKYNKGITKYILKKAAEGILPNEIIYRKKMGFAAPTTRWFKQGDTFKNYFMNLIDNATIDKRYFNKKAINNLFDANRGSDIDYSLQLWTLQNVLAMM